MKITHLDHLVLTVASLERTIAFYTRVLGMQEVTFGAGRKALSFGSQKINLHERGKELSPAARHPTPGSADLCLIVSTPLSKVVRELQKLGIPIVEGPVGRTGALGPIESVYLRDPDGNLVELSKYKPKSKGKAGTIR